MVSVDKKVNPNNEPNHDNTLYQPDEGTRLIMLKSIDRWLNDSEDKEYWEGIEKKLKSGLGLKEDELKELLDLVRDLNYLEPHEEIKIREYVINTNQIFKW